MAYTYRIGNTVDDKCLYCILRDDAEHAAFKCPRWEAWRREVEVWKWF